MSEDLNKAQQEPAAEPAAEPVSEPETQPAAPETDQAKEDSKKKDGWFNKKTRELDAIKAQLDAAEQNAAKAKDQLLRMAAEYDNYRKRSAREADQKFGDGVSFAVIRLVENGMNCNVPAEDLAPTMAQHDISMTIDLAAGEEKATVWTCDFSYEYVKINGEYHT